MVLGDIGRSPRMQNHAISFAKVGFSVNIVGYPGSPPKSAIINNKLIRIDYLQPVPEFLECANQMLTFILLIFIFS